MDKEPRKKGKITEWTYGNYFLTLTEWDYGRVEIEVHYINIEDLPKAQELLSNLTVQGLLHCSTENPRGLLTGQALKEK